MSVPGSLRLSRMCRFLMLGAVTGGTLSNVFWKVGPTFQRPAWPSGSIARTRQWYWSFLKVLIGESDDAIVVPLQQTFEPGAKSTDGLTSTSYFAAPGIGSQENFGS